MNENEEALHLIHKAEKHVNVAVDALMKGIKERNYFLTMRAGRVGFHIAALLESAESLGRLGAALKDPDADIYMG